MITTAVPAARSARRLALALAVAASTALAATSAAASAATAPFDASGNYTITTVDNPLDPTFNQLLGVNDAGVVAGYYGSGMPGHPNRGYLLAPAHEQGDYRSENVRGSAQTQVTGLNNTGITVGFSVDKAGANSGFYAYHHQFHTVDFPAHSNAKPQVDQLLGVNDAGTAVGFFTDGKGVNHGFVYSIPAQQFRMLTVSGDTNLTAAAINNEGDIAGFATNASGTVEAFLARPNSRAIKLSYPGSASTQAFGVNDGDEVVGDYTVGQGSAAETHGFTWTPGTGFETVDAPLGAAATTINGVNDRGVLVGFYTDSSMNVDGLIATPEA